MNTLQDLMDQAWDLAEQELDYPQDSDGDYSNADHQSIGQRQLEIFAELGGDLDLYEQEPQE